MRATGMRKKEKKRVKECSNVVDNSDGGDDDSTNNKHIADFLHLYKVGVGVGDRLAKLRKATWAKAEKTDGKERKIQGKRARREFEVGPSSRTGTDRARLLRRFRLVLLLVLVGSGVCAC